MQNSACVYSMICRVVKYRPSAHVIMKDMLEFFMFFFIISLWAHVTETPDLTKMIVFSKGTFMGLNVLILLGGQFRPISILGEILEWKYAQKKERKNMASDVINSIIPIFSPLVIE